MKVRVSGRARARIRRLDAWWRANRPDAPDLFERELASAVESIERAPRLRAPYDRAAGEPVFRVLLPKTEQHVYFTIDDVAGEVVIETVWGARRGRGPKL